MTKKVFFTTKPRICLLTSSAWTGMRARRPSRSNFIFAGTLSPPPSLSNCPPPNYTSTSIFSWRPSVTENLFSFSGRLSDGVFARLSNQRRWEFKVHRSNTTLILAPLCKTMMWSEVQLSARRKTRRSENGSQARGRSRSRVHHQDDSWVAGCWSPLSTVNTLSALLVPLSHSDLLHFPHLCHCGKSSVSLWC